ncbi:PREDICTED: glia maturation factor gamma-like [Acropora digitifera]|uniref:glia maturation factor gamma-like n=1 Tax=Acropora digitifera TaxID=70779 RepID=UPI00077AFA4D|nr:PREDICTED: glia maturation factor gamma-like [Acropora digitifera]
MHAYIRPSFSTFPLAGAVAKYSCPCGRDSKMSANVKICDIDPEVIAKAKKFRMRKEQNIAALICKYYDRYLLHFQSSHCTLGLKMSIKWYSYSLTVDSYVLLSYVLAHDDGRKSFPLCFIYISPQGCKPELQMMYSGSKKALEKDIGATKIFELRSVEEFTEEWLVEKLKFFR